MDAFDTAMRDARRGCMTPPTLAIGQDLFANDWLGDIASADELRRH
jgi:hypothetical protein